NNPNPALVPIIAAISALPASQQDSALNELGGEVYTASRTAMRAATVNFLETLTEDRPVTTAPVAGTAGLTAWVSAFRGFTTIAGHPNASAMGTTSEGELQGLDLPYLSDLPFFADGSIGLALGYTRSTISLQNVPQSATLTSYNFGTRGKQHWGDYFVDWGIA